MKQTLRQSQNKQSVSESMFDMDLSVGGHKYLKPAEACNWGKTVCTIGENVRHAISRQLIKVYLVASIFAAPSSW